MRPLSPRGMTADQPLTLTVEQAAAVLGVARSTAYELVRSGDIESIRLRRRIVVPTKALADKLDVSLAEVWASLTPVAQVSSPAARAPRRAPRRARGRPRPPTPQPALFDPDGLGKPPKAARAV